MTIDVKNETKVSRLKFIDLARSIAILLMLEGHFIDSTLGEQFRSPDAHFVNPDFLAYDIWHLIRGYTSPLFLTITGMVFAFLLYKKNDVAFSENDRVSKGFHRVVILLFWGYLMTPNNFHILQCIGIGLLLLLLVYGLYKVIKIIPLWIYYFVLGFVFYFTYAYFNSFKGADGEALPFPLHSYTWIQNMIFNPGNALFPIFPNLGNTFFGAALGIGLYAKPLQKNRKLIPLSFFVLGIFLTFLYTKIVYSFLEVIGDARNSFNYLGTTNWLFERLGWVLLFIAVLSFIDVFFKIKDSLFLKIGQNTFIIFIVHMMLLYGVLFPISINDFFQRGHNPLNPYQAVLGAILFLSFFFVFIKYTKQIITGIQKFWKYISPL
jgi:hypothetical protein